MSKPNIIVRIFRAIWHGADAVRKVLHLVFLLFVAMIFVAAVSGGTTILPSRAALELAPTGFLVEEYSGDPFERARQELVGNEPPPQTVVQDVIDALHYAKTDWRIQAVHLNLSGFASGGLSKLQRIADAMADFQESGKPIIASGDFFSQAGYYLAAHADEAYLHPEGIVLLQGYGSYRTYYSDLIELLRVDWNIFRVGTHKTFVEPYVRMDMSEEAREDILNLTDQLWEMYRADIVNARGLEDGDIASYADDFLALTREANGDLASAALNAGLVDDVYTRKQVRDRMIELAGRKKDFEDAHAAIGMSDFLAEVRMLNGTEVREENVAIIVAAGEITFGSPAPGTIGADSTSQLLRRALNDDSVKAVVLRVDSPGGSVFASDVIGNEVAALQAAGKPVVASMSSSAASGGYWILAGADKIYASPATITGSIGIFGMLPTYQRSLDALGVAVDGVGSTPWAGEFRPDREMSEHAKALFQTVIENGYDDFITRVATHREMEKDEVDAIGQGRVWTGVDALDNGLVDALGSLDDAVEAAAELAELDDDHGRKYIRRELSPTEQLILDLMAVGKSAGFDFGDVERRPGQIERLANRLETIISPLLRFDDPKGVYAHCLCNFE